MISSNDITPPSYHPRLKLYLDWVIRRINKQDGQVIGVVCGPVGSGKSVRAQELAYYVSGGMGIEQFGFTKEQFIRSVLKFSKTSIIADEGISIFFGRGAMTKEGRLIAELINQIRQRNLFVLICIPFPENLDNMILNMTNFIMEVYETRKRIPDDREPCGFREVIVKGNYQLFPKLKGLNYVAQYIAFRRAMGKPGKDKPKKPPYWLRDQGHIYQPGKVPFMAVDPSLYLVQKESILKKYQYQIEKTPRESRKIDYSQIDKLIIEGKTGVDIAYIAGVHISTINLRKARLRNEGKIPAKS